MQFRQSRQANWLRSTLETSYLMNTAAGVKETGALQANGSGFLAVMRRELEQVYKELWIVLSLVVLAWLLNSMVTSQRALLGFYTLPTVASAYLYGRRHATLTAFASVLLVVYMRLQNPELLGGLGTQAIAGEDWLEISAWGGTLMVTAYLMGTLYKHKNEQLVELRDTYLGILMILRHFISKDTYTENHSWRVSVYATRMAAHMGLNEARIEDIRAAALLHDIGKLDISREILYKAARLTREEFEEMKTHVERGVSLLEPVGGSLRRILPIVLAHHDKFDGTGYHPIEGEHIPLEARVIAVADAYDAMTSDRPYLKGMSFIEARDVMQQESGEDFDPVVVNAFLIAFKKGEMEAPALVV